MNYFLPFSTDPPSAYTYKARIDAALYPAPKRGVDTKGNPAGPDNYYDGAPGWTVSECSVYAAQDGSNILVFTEQTKALAQALLAAGTDLATATELQWLVGALDCDQLAPEQHAVETI